MKTLKKVYFISDGTGITAQNLGQTLLTQFEDIDFETTTLPFINSIEKAQNIIQRIMSESQGNAIIFSTLIDTEIRKEFQKAPFLCLDLFNSFISPLEQELQRKSSHSIGLTHGINLKNYNNYMLRINAVNYALNNDDGANIHDYENADVILIGVSRCGKTPTALYLALQFGVYAANYPMTEDEKSLDALPQHLIPYKKKLFGLTIDASKLSLIRQERRPNSHYASLKQCAFEIKEVEGMYRKNKLAYIDTTTRSIEEIAVEILTQCKLKKRLT